MKLRSGTPFPERSKFARRRPCARLTLIVCIGWVGVVLASGSAFAQAVSPHGGSKSGVPDVPAGPATIRGRVVHATNPAAAAGVPVVLYSLSPDGVPGLRGMVADDDGTFAFEKVAGDTSIVYLVGARYREVPFGVRMSFGPGETERSVELVIGDPSSDNANARVAEVLIRVDQGCNGLLIKESHSLENTGDLVIYVPESERAGRAPILQISVPEGATDVESTVGDSLDWDGKTISYWGPLRPGREALEFVYGLPGGGGVVEISHSFPSGVDRVRVFSHAQGPTLDATEGDVRLEAGEPLVLDGVSYAVLEARELAPGSTFTLRAELPTAIVTSEKIVGEETRIWLDLDGAELTIDEQHQLTVAGNQPLVSASGAPLLCFALDPAAVRLEFSNDTLALGLSRDPSGALAVRGPIPSGPSTFSIRYRIPVTSDVVSFTREFPFEIPLLSLMVADTGLIVETKDLHRRRPIRTQDRKYLHLEAYGVEPDSQIQVYLEPLELRRPMAQWASAGLAIVAGLLTIGFLTVPLRDDSQQGPAPQPSYYAEERQSVLASLRSLEDDFETGKLTEGDYQELRRQLRATAVSLLSQERNTVSTPTTQKHVEITPVPVCGDCGAKLVPDALFCSRCGTKVAEVSPSDGSPG